ncbi:MAG: DUF6240 domain-containing protein [Lachnospiraceae bacterium]|nr:DUF6240 domain-containing protein [Lachnospiraceae bacterium]
MNIDIINNHGADIEPHITYDRPTSYGSRMRTEKMGFSLDITGKVTENAAYGKEDLKTAEEVAQSAAMADVSVQRDYMAVMSCSMSDEDFAELMKDGADPTKIPADKMVTNLDKIKIKMAEAGNTVAGFNDDLTEEDIKAVLGNSINAGKIIADTLASSDLPATPDNVAEVKEAITIAQNLKPLSDEAKAYMITENLAPTIRNLYMAEYSSAASSNTANGIHFDGAATYAGSGYTMSTWDELKEQALSVIEDAGIADTEEALEDAKWIAKQEIPITGETLRAYSDIKDLKIPPEPRELIAAVTVAVEEGISPKNADIQKTESIYDKAADIARNFREMEDPADLTKRRQLEEVRLAMTTEANLTLLRKGINIKTQPLERLVELLKEAERELYAPLLTDKENPEEAEADISELDRRIGLYKETRSALNIIPDVPARVICERIEAGDLSLGAIAEHGAAAAERYRKAGETYEALMTAPRADMGDSIRKAFRNVDDILSDLDIQMNDANRKAVRTLGYAGMMINRENIDNVRTAVHSVERVISLMTPEKTLSMIREGHNPLKENIFELERSLSEEPFEESSEKYSRFLLRLEKSRNITEDEKQAFIGMYRLFNVIEKQDGKVVGNVLSSGRELTLENMLEASRSNRRLNEEYIVDEDFGFLEKVVEKGESITAQLDRAFLKLMDPKPDKDYIEEKQREIRTAARIAKGSEGILAAVNEPVTAENILAAAALSSGMGRGYKKLFSGRPDEEDEKKAEAEALTKEDADELIGAFDDRDSAAEAYGSFLKKASDVVKAGVSFAETYEDARTLSMMYKQIGFAAALAQRESYEVPVKFEEGWTSIHLTVVHSKERAGKVKASFESEEYGRTEASFALKSGGVDGFIVSDSRAGVDNIRRIDDKIRGEFAKLGMETANISYEFSRNAGGDESLPEEAAQQTSDRRLYQIAKAFISAVSAGT